MFELFCRFLVSFLSVRAKMSCCKANRLDQFLLNVVVNWWWTCLLCFWFITSQKIKILWEFLETLHQLDKKDVRVDVKLEQSSMTHVWGFCHLLEPEPAVCSSCLQLSLNYKVLEGDRRSGKVDSKFRARPSLVGRIRLPPTSAEDSLWNLLSFWTRIPTMNSNNVLFVCFSEKRWAGCSSKRS